MAGGDEDISLQSLARTKSPQLDSAHVVFFLVLIHLVSRPEMDDKW